MYIYTCICIYIYTCICIYIYMYEYINRASQVALMVKYSNPLQYIYCLFIFSIRIFIQTPFLQNYLGQLFSSCPIQCSYMIHFQHRFICYSLHSIFYPTFWCFFLFLYTNVTLCGTQSYRFDKWIQFITTVSQNSHMSPKCSLYTLL